MSGQRATGHGLTGGANRSGKPVDVRRASYERIVGEPQPADASNTEMSRYMRAYRRKQGGKRSLRIQTVMNREGLKWLRRCHPDVWDMIRELATAEVDQGIAEAERVFFDKPDA